MSYADSPLNSAQNTLHMLTVCKHHDRAKLWGRIWQNNVAEISEWKLCVAFLTIKPTRCTNFSNLFLEWNSTCFGTVPLSIITSFSLYTQQWYMSYRFPDSLRAVASWSCSQAVSKLVWHIPVLCVQWRVCWQLATTRIILILFASCQQTCMTYPIALCTVKGLLTACDDQDHPDPVCKLSANLYDIYHCCVYSEKLLMMGRGTVRNM